MRSLKLVMLTLVIALNGCASGIKLTSTPAAAPSQKSNEANVYSPREPDFGKTDSKIGHIQVGTSSYTVEKLARERGCISNGASLTTDKGPSEEYEVKCNSGKVIRAHCELRQCRLVD